MLSHAEIHIIWLVYFAFKASELNCNKGNLIIWNSNINCVNKLNYSLLHIICSFGKYLSILLYTKTF